MTDTDTSDSHRTRARFTLAAAALAVVTATAVVVVAGRAEGQRPPLPAARSASPLPSASPPTTATTPSATPRKAAPDRAVAGPAELVALEQVGERVQMVLVSTETGRRTRLLRYSSWADLSGLGVDLSPDRRTVYYSARDHMLYEPDGWQTSCGSVYAMTLGKDLVHRLALGDQPRVSPDGRFLAVMTGCPMEDLTIIDLRTNARRTFPLAPTLTGRPDSFGTYLQPVRDYTWTQDGRLALMGWAGHDLTMVLFDPATDRRIADGRRVDVDDWYWQVRAYGDDDLLFVGKHRLDVRDGGTGTPRTLLPPDEPHFVVSNVAIGPDGRAAYEDDGRLWFFDTEGRRRAGPRLRGYVADW